MAIRLFWNAQNCFGKRCFTTIRPFKLKTGHVHCQQPARGSGSLTKFRPETRNPNAAQNPEELLVWSRMWRPVAFTVVFTGTTFGIAAIAEHERIKKRIQLFLKPKHQIIKVGEWRQALSDIWSAIPDSKRMFISISFLNCLVFAAWRVPRWHGFLQQYFTASPASRTLCLPMLLSTFSHVNLWHILLNMYVLDNFSAIAVPALGREQFLALYLSSGVVGNLLSYAYKIARKKPVPSVGASGSIFGVFGFIATQFPMLKFHIIFLPMMAFTASQAFYGFATIETAACLIGWSFMDHAGHLGGLLFGAFWQKWARENLWPYRVHLLKLWEGTHESFRIPKEH